MPHPYAFLYNGSTVQKRHIAEFSETLLRDAMLAWAHGSHTGNFIPHLDFRIIGNKRRYSKHGAVIFNTAWRTKKPVKIESRQPGGEAEKHISLISCNANLFTSSEWSILDLYAGAMPIAIVPLAMKRTCVFIEKDDSCFHVSPKLVAHSARLVQRADDGTIVTSAVDLKKIVHQMSLAIDACSESSDKAMDLPWPVEVESEPNSICSSAETPTFWCTC